MGKLKKAGGVVAAIATQLDVQRNDVHGEIDRVAIGPVPLFTRDDKGKPYLFGFIPMRRRKAPRA